MEGVFRTVVGYAGGRKKNPTYHSLGRHAETLRIEYDPERVAYEELLRVFWEEHDPTARPWSTQYRSAIFTHGEEQERIARESLARTGERLGRKVYTAIEPAGPFWPAEDYHQKYLHRRTGFLMRELRAAYPEEDRFIASTAAARLNGYMGGHGSPERFEEEAERLGVGPEARAKLLAMLISHHGRSPSGSSCAAPPPGGGTASP